MPKDGIILRWSVITDSGAQHIRMETTTSNKYFWKFSKLSIQCELGDALYGKNFVR